MLIISPITGVKYNKLSSQGRKRFRVAIPAIRGTKTRAPAVKIRYLMTDNFETEERPPPGEESRRLS